MMNTIFSRPYAFVVTICYQLISIILFVYSELFISSMFFLVGSFYIMISLSKGTIKHFRIGQILIYLGCIFFYIDIIFYTPFILTIFFIGAFYMLHQTLEYILHIEY